eukprot:GILJ01000894.1.p1 GENE.GILJ01000894.1~~GILJ01000894.1.p1  ORF type:complete len:265 (-),score=37.32 GILJ01000894.1:304-1098(-)
MSRHLIVIFSVAVFAGTLLVVLPTQQPHVKEKDRFLPSDVQKGRATNVNIHIKVSATEGKNAALSAFHELGKTLKNNRLDFDGTNDPHVTLYLTNFVTDRLQELAARVGAVVKKLGSCSMEMDKLVVQGAYGMWNLKVTECLRQYSDEIVLATSDLVDAQSKNYIPAWVKALPEPLRSKKIDMIHKYGSPNVFESFEPHLTLAYDTTEPLDSAFASLHVSSALSFPAEMLALGSVGVGGSVLTGKDFDSFAIKDDETAPTVADN